MDELQLERIDFQQGKARWLPMLIALSLMGLQILLWAIFAITDWHDGLVFYPVSYLYDLKLQIYMSCFILPFVGFGVLWALPETINGCGSLVALVFIALTIWTVAFFQTGSGWFGISLKPTDSLSSNGHIYRLTIEMNHGSDLTYDTFIVYRCDRLGLFCRSIYVEKVDDPFGRLSPAVAASRTGDLRLVRDDAGHLTIHYYDEVLFITDTTE